jgi:hypothetical protein
MARARHLLCASAEGDLQHTMAGATRASESSVSACTMNSASSTQRVRSPSRMGSPTWWLHTGRPSFPTSWE